MGACRSISDRAAGWKIGEAGSSASGLVHIQLPVTAAAITGAITHGHGEKIAASTMLNAKAAVAASLPRRLIAPFSRHATM